MSIKENEVNIDPAALEQEMGKVIHNAEADAGVQAAECLASRRQGLGKKVKAGVSRVAMIVNLSLALVLTILVGVAYYHTTTGKFYSSRAVDERSCRITVGKDWHLLGRRYYTYNYTELFGVRLIDSSNIDERTELFVDSSEMIIAGVTEDGQWWSEEQPMGEPGVVPLKDAARYIVFSGKVVGSTTYQDFCKQFNKTHPFATIGSGD